MHTPGFNPDPRLRRRQLVRGALASLAAVGLAACARRAPEDIATPAPAPAPTAASAPPHRSRRAALRPQLCTNPKNWKVSGFAVATPAPASAAGAAPTPAPTGVGQPKRGGTLLVATQTDWTTFDSIYNSANGSTALMVMDPLFFYKPDGTGGWHVTGALIEKWDSSDTAMTWQLRKGVTFHD